MKLPFPHAVKVRFNCLTGCLLLINATCAHGQVPRFEWVSTATSAVTNSCGGLSVATDLQGGIFAGGFFSDRFFSLGAFVLANGSPSYGTSDFYLGAFNSAGETVWAASGGTELDDSASGIATDLNGSVYLSNRSGNTDHLQRRSSAGGLYWNVPVLPAEDANLSGVAADAAGDCYVSGDVGGEAFLAKYNSGGTLLWITRGGGTANGTAVAVNKAGEAFLTGTYSSSPAVFGGLTLTNSRPSSPSAEMFLVKFSSQGEALWARSGVGSGSARGASVVVDSDGACLVTGTFAGSMNLGATNLSALGGGDVFIAKYNSDGNLLWARRAGGSGQDLGTGIAVDFGGNSFVVGRFSATAAFGTTNLVSAGGNDAFVSSYDSLGNFRWALRAGGILDDNAWGVATDDMNNLYVTGSVEGLATIGSTNLTNSLRYQMYLAKLRDVTFAPNITNQPVSQIVTAGPAAHFSVGAFGTAPLHYQWRYNGLDIKRGTNSTLAVGTQQANEGNYSVVLSNRYGMTTSSIATLTVHYAIDASSGGGTVARIPDLVNYPLGSMVSLTASPSPGWTFLHWLGDVSGTNPSVNVQVTRNLCLSPVFGTTLATITDGNGSITVDPISPFYPFGGVIRLTGIPQSGSYFASWGNAASGTNAPLLFVTTNANPIVSCSFGALGLNEVALTVLPNGKGHVSVSPFGSRFNLNQSVSLSALPDANQSFLGWGGDVTGMETNIVVVLNGSKVITANFTKSPMLFVDPCGGGSRDDGFRFTLAGEFGAAYQVDCTFTLTSWSSLAVITNSFGTSQFLDSSATNLSRRFYRVRSSP